MNERIWRLAEANIASRAAKHEKRRLIKAGFIRFKSFPNVLVKTSDGDWKFPEIQTRKQQ